VNLIVNLRLESIIDKLNSMVRHIYQLNTLIDVLLVRDIQCII